MYLTMEYLEKHGACKPGKAWFRRRYPNGGEIKDIVMNRTVSEDLVDWAIHNIHLSEEEWQAYWKKCEIDCPGTEKTIQRSKKIYHSENVIRSTQVSDSKEVHHSKNISTSQTVSLSEEVEGSKKVFASSYVYDSDRVFEGTNINNSQNIVESQFIINSNNVIYATNVEDSAFVTALKPDLVENVKNSYFVYNCRDIEHCLFCSSLKNDQYCLFNLPIDEKKFKIIEKQFLNIMKKEKLNFVKRWPVDEIPLTEPQMIVGPADWYSKLSPKFWDWVKTLPGYDPITLYTITYNKELLTKKK
jgi:hypothetical protein